MRNTKKIIKESQTSVVNIETGELLESRNYTQRLVEVEPNFIKVYLDDIAKLADLPKGCSNVMYHLLRYMTYDNVIGLTPFIRNTIAKSLNTNTHTLNQQITELVNQGILARIGRGTYFVNPDLFGKGKWQDIRNLRLTITYDRNGRTFSTDRNFAQQLEIEGMESNKGINGFPPFVPPLQIFACN